jgi:DNA-binding NtrC family response regulator
MQRIYPPEFCIVEALVEDKRFSEARKALEKICVNSLSSQEYAYYCLMVSEVNLCLGKYDTINILEDAIKYFKYGTDNEHYGKAKFLLGKLLTSKGDYLEAKESLVEAYASYKRCDNSLGCARVLNQLSYISQIMGDIDAAVSYLGQCCDIYNKLKYKRGYFASTNNLATTYKRSGQLKLSMAQYKYLFDRKSELQDDIRFQFLIGFSAVKAIMGNIPEALDVLNETQDLSQDFKRENAQYYEFLGAIYNLDGKYRAAEINLQKAVGLALGLAPESDHVSQTKRLLADTYLGLKKYDLAQKFAEEALVVAEKINERAEIAACYRVFAQVAPHGDKNDKAKEWFKKAIDLFAMIQSRYELAVTRYLYATSGLCDNNERIALLYMAREYFIAEEIQPYIEKVDKALASSVVPRPIPKASGDGAPVFIAVSPKTKIILDKADHFAPTDYTVLITGPTGVGKDQLAKYIHWASGRKGEYYSFNCAAFPETMIEAELFGYCAGAFTDAKRDKKSLIELAEKGTLCLNEIGDMPERIQIRLLEFLDSKEVRPVGSTIWKKLDVKIIAATNRDLEAAMKSGLFRRDLFYRLNQARIELPPLSERKEDIPALTKYFLKLLDLDIDHNGNLEKFDRLCDLLSSRDWPGNVRELESRIKRLYENAGGDLKRMVAIIDSETLSERDRLVKILEQTGWNQREAARQLGVNESTLRYHIKKLQLSKE